MTLSSRHRIRNSSPGGLRPSTLSLGHGGSPQFASLRLSREETFVTLKPECQSGGRTCDLRLSRQAAITLTYTIHCTSAASKHKTFTRCWLNVGQCRRRWANIKAVIQRLVFAGRLTLVNDIHPMLFEYWTSVADDRPTFYQHLVKSSACRAIIPLTVIDVTWRETWRNGQSVTLCFCLPWGFKPRLVKDFQKNIIFPPSDAWLFRRQILTYKVDPRAGRVKWHIRLTAATDVIITLTL